MRPFQFLLLLFLLIPMLEIYLLIQIGGVIGAWPTVLLVIATAVLGAFLLRQQGLATMLRIRETLMMGGLPAMEMLEGAVLLMSGALLLTPGFFTDALGFLGLVPPLRRALLRKVMERLIVSHPPGGAGPRGPYTINGEFKREDD